MTDETHPEHDQIHERLDDLEGSISEKLDAITVQTTATNGRTARLEYTIYGDPTRRMPHGSKDRGLQGQVQANQPLIDSVETVIKTAKWTAMTFGAAALGLIGNLAAGLF